MNKIKNNQHGVVLATLVIVTMVVFAIVLIVTQTVVDNYVTVLGEKYRVNAQFAADAGVDYAITQLNQDETWTGVVETDLFDNGDFKTTYEVTTSDLTSGRKELLVVGRSYDPTGASEPKSSRSITVELYSVSSGGLGASIVTGVGGLIMQNSSKIVDGDVIVNGEIRMKNTAQIGTSTNSVTVRAAHQNCPDPANASYPQVCGPSENGEPITMENSAHIYADVQATNQSDGSGMSSPGLQPGSPSPQALPPHDRDAQKANITKTTSDSYYTKCDKNNETRTWEGRLKIEGDVEISKKCKIIITGDVWITGKFDMSNTAQMIVSDTISLGSPNTVDPDRPSIMVDGDVATLQNSAKLVGNSTDTGLMLITYWSKAGCSPDCADVTGTDLYDSREENTLILKNSYEAPNSVLYAKWSQIKIENSGDIGALVGQTVLMQNSTTVTFGTSVPGGGADITWLVYSYRQS